MTKTHQLEATLRSLALSGMLETIEARLAQAHAGELGHVEFLQTLCEDELSRRDAAGIIRRVRAARFEQSCAIEDYDFTYNPKVPAGLIRDLATLRFVEAGESVILHGPVGVGKTMVAQALGHQACRRGHTALFTKTSRLLADLAGGHADRTWESRLRRWSRGSARRHRAPPARGPASSRSLLPAHRPGWPAAAPPPHWLPGRHRVEVASRPPR
jgi:DNA replication protein DnaC